MRPACPGKRPVGDLAWMPDGKKILFSAPTAQFATEEHYFRLLDLATGEVTRFPGAEGLHSPRVSPDGSTIAAWVWKGPPWELALYRFSEAKWRRLRFPDDTTPTWNSWSHDGESIWYYDWNRHVIMRCHVRENRHEEMVRLTAEEGTGLIGYWFNLTPSDEPMILLRRDIQQIYALNWKER